MLRNLLMASLLTLAAAAHPIGAAAAPAPRPEVAVNLETRQPIRNWYPDGDMALFFEDQGSNWYHATLASLCPDLMAKKDIKFITGPNGKFEDSSAITAGAVRCNVKSVVRAAEPIMAVRDL